MSRKVAKIGECVACGTPVPANEKYVMGKKPHPQGIMIVFSCPNCELIQHRLMLPEELKRRAATARSEVQKIEAKRRLGVLVKGFAIDLEAVDTLDDITLYWEHQESVDPGSVPLEDRMWKNG